MAYDGAFWPCLACATGISFTLILPETLRYKSKYILIAVQYEVKLMQQIRFGFYWSKIL